MPGGSHFYSQKGRSSLVWIVPQSELAWARSSSLPQMIGLRVLGHQGWRSVLGISGLRQVGALPLTNQQKSCWLVTHKLVGRPQLVGQPTVGGSAQQGMEECPLVLTKPQFPTRPGITKLKENQIRGENGYCHRRDPVCERTSRRGERDHVSWQSLCAVQFFLEFPEYREDPRPLRGPPSP